MTKRQKLKILRSSRDASLMAAMFFLPLGYDLLFKTLLDYTGSFWATDIIFYSLSGVFWLSYFLLSKSLKPKE
jgi:cellulose synthase/poly-beta-1,6-N-acetylglucosamine synthase-like glycosyltransferase